MIDCQCLFLCVMLSNLVLTNELMIRNKVLGKNIVVIVVVGVSCFNSIGWKIRESSISNDTSFSLCFSNFVKMKKLYCDFKSALIACLPVEDTKRENCPPLEGKALAKICKTYECLFYFYFYFLFFFQVNGALNSHPQ